jgi:hypothetical protein
MQCYQLRGLYVNIVLPINNATSSVKVDGDRKPWVFGDLEPRSYLSRSSYKAVPPTPPYITPQFPVPSLAVFYSTPRMHSAFHRFEYSRGLV